MILDNISGGIFYIRDDGDTMADGTIENTGFSNVWSTDNGNMRKHEDKKKESKNTDKCEKATYFTVSNWCFIL